MKKKSYRQISVILITLALVVSMMPMSVFADTEFGPEWTAQERRLMDPKDPNFDPKDNLNPYGYDPGVPFLMSEETEIFMLKGADKFSKDVKTVIWDEKTEENTHTGRCFDGYAKETKIEDFPTEGGVKSLNFTQAVSFDPTGSGRKDHVAVVGVNSSPTAYVFVYDTGKKKWAGLKLSDMWWVGNDSEFYQMSNFISITAGDYDGDGEDSLVIYIAGESNKGGNYDGYGLVEVSVDSDDSSIVLNRVSDSTDVNVVSHDLLNPAYVANYTKIRAKDKDNDHGYVRLHGDVESGDFNEDGIDDLAVLSYSMAYDSKDFDVHAHMPYLAVSYGDKDEDIIRPCQYESYVTSDVASPYSTMCNAGMTVVNADGKGGDDIVIAGHSVDYKFSSNGHYDGQSRHDNVRIAKYEFSTKQDELSGIECKFITDKGFDLNGNSVTFADNGFSNHWSGKWDVYPQMSVQGVYMNGKGNPGYVEIGGDIYDCSKDDGAIKVYTNVFTSHSDDACSSNIINCNYIPYAIAGNFDGNDGGFQQVIIALGRKVEGSDQNYISYQMIGIDNSKHDPETGEPTAANLSTSFYESGDCSEYDISHRGDNLDKKLSCLIVPVDADDDGVMARYSGKECYYTDPEVLAILQAPPYFGELTHPGGVGTTGINFTQSITKANGTSHTSTVATGSTSTVKTPVAVANMSIGYSYNETTSFTESYTCSETLPFTSYGDDRVILYRTPVYVYKYDIYDPEKADELDEHLVDDDWVKSAMLIKTMHQARIENMSLDRYNAFVDHYNTYMTNLQQATADKIRTHNNEYPNDQINPINFTQLEEIDADTCHLKNQGKPEEYIGLYNNNDKDTLNLTPLTKNVMVMPDGYGTAGDSMSLNKSYTETKSTSHGITFNSSVMVGISAIGTGVMSGGFLNATGSWGTSTTTTNASSISVSGNLYGATAEPPELLDQYQLEAQLSSWDSDIPAASVSEEDKNNKEYLKKHHAYIPIYGYYITSLGKPVAEDDEDEDKNEDEDKDKDADYPNDLTVEPTVEDKGTVENNASTNESALTADSSNLLASPNEDENQNEVQNSESFTLRWKDKSSYNGRYGIYVFCNDDGNVGYKRVGTTPAGVKEFPYKPETVQPITQFAVARIDNDGNPVSVFSNAAYGLAKGYFSNLKSLALEKASFETIVTYDEETRKSREEASPFIEKLKAEIEGKPGIQTFGGVSEIVKTNVGDDGTRTFQVIFKDEDKDPINIEVGNNIENRGVESISVDEGNSREFYNVYKLVLDNGQESYFRLPNGKILEEFKDSYEECIHDYVIMNDLCPSDTAGRTADLKCTKCGNVLREGKEIPPTSEKYKVVKYNGVKVEEGHSRFLNLRTDAENMALGLVKVDGNVIDPANYSYDMDECTLRLNPEFVEKLSRGQHTVLIAYEDGYAKASINVVEKAKESSESDKGGIGIKTGDTENVIPYIILMIAVLAAGCIIFVRRRDQ